MTLPSPSDGRNRSVTTTAHPSDTSYFTSQVPARFGASRDSSQTRGRASSASSPQNASFRAGYSSAAAPPQAGHGTPPELERRPSQSYGHHRQTSIVHGVQHSRNTSALNTVQSTSPLGPPKIMATGDGVHDLNKSPSLSTLHANTSHSSVLPINRSFDNTAAPRGIERMRSGRLRRNHDHQRSLSRPQGEQSHIPTTVGEYALHHLFTRFIAAADERIELCIAGQGNRDPRVENVCGPGADPAFDQLISSLGHINRHKPKSLIDAMILWRQGKADTANAIVGEIQSIRDSVRTTPQHTPSDSFSTSTSVSGGSDLLSLENSLAVADRRSTVSVYILCRVLAEVIGQTTLTALNASDTTVNTAARLEEVIYSQLQSAEPESLASSPLRKANWVIRGQLLGVMSGLRFQQVVDKFIRDIERAHKRLSVKGMGDPRLASKTAMLVHSMRWIKVRSQPEDAWEQSCDMLQVLANFFAEVHGRVMKHAYAELFEQLLLSIAATATSELNMPKWKDVLATIQPKIVQMLSKADHWPYVFPLSAVLLCVSPADQFASQWLALVSTSQARVKDRSGRSHVLKATCRLVWRYLYRHDEAQPVVTRRLDELIRLVFQGGKRVLISTDPVIADPLIQLIRIIGYKYQDICFRTIIFPLMSAESFFNADGQQKIENLDPEKTVIAIRAFLAIMGDLEKRRPPPYPTTFECDALMDPTSRSPVTHRRTKSQGFALSAGRTERLSQPVLTNNLNDIAKEYYVRFCQILGQLTIICDNTFGGQAVLDERIASQTPKTPMAEAFAFNRKDDFTNPTDLRQHYYDLFHVAVEALPRCVSPHLPINALVNLLCTGTAHMQSHIAATSMQSLKSIARQSYAQQVTIGFARYIFNFDDRYANSRLLGPGHVEGTLKLYLELLQIWLEDVQKRAQKVLANPDEDMASRKVALDYGSIVAHLDEVESYGLFFLCSASSSVRAVALDVLRLLTQFDEVLLKFEKGSPANFARLIAILDDPDKYNMRFDDDFLTLAEKSRLHKGQKMGILRELCCSEVSYDAALWWKIFAKIIRTAAEWLQAVVLTRELVCQRLFHSYRTIGALVDGSKQAINTALDLNMPPGRQQGAGRSNGASPEVVIEQWKIHLIFACTTVTNVSQGQSHKSSSSVQHSRNGSKSSSTSSEKVTSAFELFSKAVPFLTAPNHSVRTATVMGLCATNAALFPILLQVLQPFVMECGNETKALHQRNLSSPRRNRRTDTLRSDITQIFAATCHHIPIPADKSILEDDFATTYLIDYSKHLRIYLSDAEVQADFDLQRLRTHFCSLVESLYDRTHMLKDAIRYMSFQSRLALFSLMENWCGFSPNERQLRQHEENVRRSILEQEHDARRQGVINSAFEKQRIELQNAALSAMAALCAGPLNFIADGRILHQFDVRRMLAWIHSMFDNPSDRAHTIGQRALSKLIKHNPDHTTLMKQAMRMCYTAKKPKALASYFEVVSGLLLDGEHPVVVPLWRVFCLGLYNLGSDNTQVRMRSVRLMRRLEENMLPKVSPGAVPPKEAPGSTSNLQDLEISVSDRTTAVYKLAQFEVSRRLSQQHSTLAFHVLSEFCTVFKDLPQDQQRTMVSAMLPWIQSIELRVDVAGNPVVESYMLLVNLIELTVRSSVTLHNETQALWQALASGPHVNNVTIILNFIIKTCLEKREQNFVIFAKQVIVFLSKTPGGTRIVDHLMLSISPKSMVVEHREPSLPPSDTADLPYVADLDLVLPSGAKHNGMSLAQICMILLVDLMVSPFVLSAEKIPALLHVAVVQWDQNVTIVQDQARELAVHLIHELVISKVEPGELKTETEEFVEAIRNQAVDITWAYTDTDFGAAKEKGAAVLHPMTQVMDALIKAFTIVSPSFREDWAAIAIDWATTCAVQHTACRSLQVFRCLSTTMDSRMLYPTLSRLSCTIADTETAGFPSYSMEILTTLRMTIRKLPIDQLILSPQLFWTTCAALDTTLEVEYQEALEMMRELMEKFDLTDPATLQSLMDGRPRTWDTVFHGVHPLLHSGLRSKQSMEQALLLMERLVKVPSNDIVGPDDRLLFTLFANLPRYLRSFEDFGADIDCLDSTHSLASIAEHQKRESLARVLQGFGRGKYRNEDDFLAQCIAAIRTSYFPTYELPSLVFLLGMVNNQSAWFKVRTMQVLRVVIAEIDMHKLEIASHGPDLISPLLRLLQTEHCQQALDVLDGVLDMIGTPFDNKHLRMSMAGSHSSRATRREYQSTKSLYGIPEESGWSVPMPAIRSEQTRKNVAAVAESLNTFSLNGMHEPSRTPEVEFEHEESPDSYFGNDASFAMSTGAKMDEGNMHELALKLDSLDDFFDEPGDDMMSVDLDGSSYLDGSRITERENLYDQQVAPILRRSMRRNASITSFQTGFTDSVYPPPRETTHAMNPSAFAQNHKASSSFHHRPRLHNRSATSPIMRTMNTFSPQSAQSDLHYAADDSLDDTDAAFSDDEFTLERARTSEEARRHYQQQDATVKPAGFKAGFRQGLRRLTSTGGKGEAREALRLAAAAGAPMKSPKVPKVPANLAQYPMSGEL
ncbi:putative cell morphogenesis protein [Neohortaea acidophila]|uniref:Putative cell morphogenesis protein n=1 Tax=Neohortaea acidophila TaxID=245834 RepID=A0A6A6Q757_9PEZI|nr:putative cell morphogenesis protein [Neohortaea acidophila]KAF2488220.1 putative cell morphogenesis protein [Neohortaea acidophila]